MLLKYDLEVESKSIQISLKRLTNQIYKLLPTREEGEDWRKPLVTILEELSGMNRLFLLEQPVLYKLICKLEGLFELENSNDFYIYRGVIFECLGIMGELMKCLD